MRYTRGILIAMFWQLFAASAVLAAGPEVLIGQGSVWKFLDTGLDPGSAWREPGWSDAGWSSGPAKLGYGDGDEATVIDCGPSRPSCNLDNRATTYFRKTFQVADASRYGSLTVRLRRDDGAVVYLNGNPVVHTNLPDSVSHQTWALAAVGGAEETTFFSFHIPASGLLSGTNLLAVEIHQSSGTSSDLGFDLELLGNVGGAPQAVIRGPYLQQLTATGVTVRWRTTAASSSRVCIGLAPDNLGYCLDQPQLTAEHQVEVAGLSADTTYYYAVGDAGGLLTGGDLSTRFTTASVGPGARSSRIWVLGDSGRADASARAVRDGYLRYAGSHSADLCLMLGDNAYNTGTDAEYQRAVFDTYAQLLRRCPLWSTFGNHDGYSASAATQTGPYFELFTFPRAAQAGGWPSGTEAYYAFDHGLVHFIVLDANESDRSISGPMVQWLRADLEQTQARWIIALWHHPPYTKGSHDSDSLTDSEGRMVQMRENILPILEAYGVDVVLTGHSHAYERSMLLNGHYGYSSAFNRSLHALDAGSGRPGAGGPYRKPAVLKAAHAGTVYVVAGSSGAAGGGPLNHPAMHTSLNLLGSMVIDVSANRLEASMVDSQGEVRDQFVIAKGVDLTPVLMLLLD